MANLISETICIKCYFRWISKMPAEVMLRDLECPNCHTVGTVILTGGSTEYEDDEE